MWRLRTSSSSRKRWRCPQGTCLSIYPNHLTCNSQFSGVQVVILCPAIRWRFAAACILHFAPPITNESASTSKCVTAQAGATLKKGPCARSAVRSFFLITREKNQKNRSRLPLCHPQMNCLGFSHEREGRLVGRAPVCQKGRHREGGPSWPTQHLCKALPFSWWRA
jgi:hypothetical protein